MTQAIQTHLQPAGLVSRRLIVSLALTLAFMLFEALAGYFANSLALLTDAAHNFTDVVALALSWYALRLTTRPANSDRTFGYHRAGILAALVNSTALAVIALGIFYEAYQRLFSPPRVETNILIGVAALGFVVNVGTAGIVKRGGQNDLNVRSTFIHLAGDAVSTLGAFVAGIGMALTGLQVLDPLVSILIGVLILWNAWKIVRETVDILLESTPRDVDMNAMVRDLLRVDGVRSIHDLHVWSISANLRALSAHVLTDNVSISEGARVQRDINAVLMTTYGIGHATLQMECAGCEPDLLYCEMNPTEEQKASHSHGR